MSKFLVMYQVPVAVIENWKTTDVETRKPAEEKMRQQWDAWMGEYGPAVTTTEAAGRTKRVTADGIADTKNDLMLYSTVEAPSHEAAAAMFAAHPHLQIPQSWIEITEVRAMGGPQG